MESGISLCLPSYLSVSLSIPPFPLKCRFLFRAFSGSACTAYQLGCGACCLLTDQRTDRPFGYRVTALTLSRASSLGTLHRSSHSYGTESKKEVVDCPAFHLGPGFKTSRAEPHWPSHTWPSPT